MDLKLRYSDSMAMTKLMLYVSAGHFDAALSAFVVPVKKKREESGRRRRRKTAEEDEVCLTRQSVPVARTSPLYDKP